MWDDRYKEPSPAEEDVPCPDCEAGTLHGDRYFWECNNPDCEFADENLPEPPEDWQLRSWYE